MVEYSITLIKRMKPRRQNHRGFTRGLLRLLDQKEQPSPTAQDIHHQRLLIA